MNELKKIILVFKTHFDIGFTDLKSNVLEQYTTTMLDDLLTTCEASQNDKDLKYVWSMPSWPLTHMLEHASSDKKIRLVKMIENKQVCWHGLPYTSHFDICGIEDYIRGFSYAKELSDRFKMPYPVAAKMTDVPGHGRMLPTVLSSAGIEFLHLGCNEFATPPEVPFLFHWVGPDGSRVLTMYNKDGYGSGIVPTEDWEYPVWMALMSTHDNSGPQSASFIKETVEKIQKQYPNVEVVTGTLDDFYKELAVCNLSTLPVIEKDLADTWIHGAMTYPNEMKELRKIRTQLPYLELYHNLVGNDKNQVVKDIYQEINHFCEHTWGCDIKTWLKKRIYDKDVFELEHKQGKYDMVEKSWNEQRNYITKALAYFEELHELEPKMIFNPSPYKKSGWITLDTNVDATHINVGDTSYEIQQVLQDKKVFVKDVEPLSSTAFEYTNAKVVPLEKGENHRYKINFSEIDGIIDSIYDKELKVNIVKRNEDCGLFEYRYQVISRKEIDEYLRTYGVTFSDWGINDNGRVEYPNGKSLLECGKFEYSTWIDQTLSLYFTNVLHEEFGNAKSHCIKISLPKAEEGIFVSITLENKQRTPYVEGGSFTIPVACDNAAVYVHKNGHEVDIYNEIIENGNHNYYAIDQYVRVQGEHDIVVVSKDVALCSLDHHGVYQFKGKVEKTAPNLYFNLFNNMWGTNFPQWMEGTYAFEFVLLSADKITQKSIQEAQDSLLLVEKEIPYSTLLTGDVEILHYEQQETQSIVRVRNTHRQNVNFALLCDELEWTKIDVHGQVMDHKLNRNITIQPFEIQTLKITPKK